MHRRSPRLSRRAAPRLAGVSLLPPPFFFQRGEGINLGLGGGEGGGGNVFVAYESVFLDYCRQT